MKFLAAICAKRALSVMNQHAMHNATGFTADMDFSPIDQPEVRR